MDFSVSVQTVGAMVREKGNIAGIVQFPQGLEGEIPTLGSPRSARKGENGRGSIQSQECWELKGNSQFQGVLASLGIPLEVMDPSLCQFLPSSHS